MLAAMIDAWEAWLLVVGLAIGGLATAVFLVRLPRRDDDVDPHERRTEAAWIAGTVERYGGVAPTSLVEEVLDLHQAYLQVQRPPQPPPPPPGLAVGPPQPGYTVPAGYAVPPGNAVPRGNAVPPAYPPVPGYPPPTGTAPPAPGDWPSAPGDWPPAPPPTRGR
jgi:hypothetical protein